MRTTTKTDQCHASDDPHLTNDCCALLREQCNLNFFSRFLAASKGGEAQLRPLPLLLIGSRRDRKRSRSPEKQQCSEQRAFGKKPAATAANHRLINITVPHDAIDRLSVNRARLAYGLLWRSSCCCHGTKFRELQYFAHVNARRAQKKLRTVLKTVLPKHFSHLRRIELAQRIDMI